MPCFIFFHTLGDNFFSASTTAKGYELWTSDQTIGSTNVKLSIKDVNGKAIFANTFENANGLISIPVNLSYGAYILAAEKIKKEKL